MNSLYISISKKPRVVKIGRTHRKVSVRIQEHVRNTNFDFNATKYYSANAISCEQFENVWLSTLADLGIFPCKGKEFFKLKHLGVIESVFNAIVLIDKKYTKLNGGKPSSVKKLIPR